MLLPPAAFALWMADWKPVKALALAVGVGSPVLVIYLVAWLLRLRRKPRDAFSKKLDNHKAALALHFMHYNFGRIHKTLRVTPAMEAGVSDHVWALNEIACLAH